MTAPIKTYPPSPEPAAPSDPVYPHSPTDPNASYPEVASTEEQRARAGKLSPPDPTRPYPTTPEQRTEQARLADLPRHVDPNAVPIHPPYPPAPYPPAITISSICHNVAAKPSMAEGVFTMLADLRHGVQVALGGEVSLTPAASARLDALFAINDADAKRMAASLVINTPSA